MEAIMDARGTIMVALAVLVWGTVGSSYGKARSTTECSIDECRVECEQAGSAVAFCTDQGCMCAISPLDLPDPTPVPPVAPIPVCPSQPPTCDCDGPEQRVSKSTIDVDRQQLGVAAPPSTAQRSIEFSNGSQQHGSSAPQVTIPPPVIPSPPPVIPSPPPVTPAPPWVRLPSSPLSTVVGLVEATGEISGGGACRPPAGTVPPRPASRWTADQGARRLSQRSRLVSQRVSIMSSVSVARPAVSVQLGR
jgi:hypothetical protein